MKKKLITFVGLLFAGLTLAAQTSYQWKTGNSGGYNYKYVTNDPTQTRFYTLKNGLTVILSKNNKEPKISFKMAVRAGSNTDPRSNTGLAHYLEHLLFKGTDKFGTIDYQKEKPLLDKIEALYEEYNKTKDASKRKAIYAEIDKISNEASNYSIANEYDKMMKSIGSATTNAHTSVEETIYHEDLPSNAVDKFLAVQAERFRNPVFRIFHTELEAVYEEKNQSLDNDGRKMYEGVLKALFPTHNYGQQTTIGTIEHLKNPSLVEIRKYFNKYYVPNNMALIMAGDIDYDNLIKKIEKNFSYMVPKIFDPYQPTAEKALTKVQTIDVYGPTPENLYIAYRGFAQNSHESLLLDLTSSILSNGKAGLLDININKKQRVLRAASTYNQMKDYGIFILQGSPKAGQDIDEVKKLLLEQIDLLKNGAFDESLIKATVANIKLDEIQNQDNNTYRAVSAANSFIQNRGLLWNKYLSAADDLGKITKQEIVDFAKRFFKENYVQVIKHKGPDKSITKIDKPAITAVKTNTNQVSTFVKQIVGAETVPIAPKFLDYSKDLSQAKAKIADVITVKNNENGIFRMAYRFEMGSYNYKLLPYAVQYLNFLGTDKYSAEDISRAFYNIACSYNIGVTGERTTISLAGLDENFVEAAKLVEHLLANCKADEKALAELKANILKSRDNAKLNKSAIMNGITTYAQFGPKNPFNNVLSDAEIKDLKSSDLIYILRNLTNYEHTITYYGPRTNSTFVKDIASIHALPSEFTPIAPAATFDYASTDSTKVLFADYDMVQADIRWFRNSGLYAPDHSAEISLFNNYFGGGMGSIVFQTIRESKALAYSTNAVYITPDSRSKQTAMIAFVGTQSDKMNEAVAGMNELLTTLPAFEKSFNLSKSSALTSLQTERVNMDGIIANYLADKKLGFKEDSRIQKYKQLKSLTFDDVKAFHRNNVSGKKYIYCIVADEDKINKQDLEKLGTVKKLSLEEIFGY